MERINGLIYEKTMKKSLLGAIHLLKMSWDDHSLAANGSMACWPRTREMERERYIYDIGISSMTEKHGLPLVAPKKLDTIDLNQQLPDLVNKLSHLGMRHFIFHVTSSCVLNSNLDVASLCRQSSVMRRFPISPNST